MHPRDIPGMIEPVEQDLLGELATYARLGSEGVVCEFGAYFGRSTMCLAQGLLANDSLDLTGRKTPVLRTYDAFACHKSGMLGRYVVNDASRARLRELLAVDGDKLNFLPLFDHFVAGLPQGLLSRFPIELSQARHSGEPIVLMHVDAPKWYAEYMQVLRGFGPCLQVGARVVFQDFFYHWSASVIGAIELMFEQGLIEPMESAASSLLVKVVKPLPAATIQQLHLEYQARRLDDLIDAAVLRFERFEIDRREMFLPRLMLAGVQASFESGDFQRSHAWFRRAVALGGGTLGPTGLQDMANLIEHGFAMRKFYELDITVGKPEPGAAP